MARFVMDVSPFVCQGGRMTPQQRHALVRNNLVAYLLGGGLMVLIHEVVHWLVGAALGYRSTMFSYGVTQQPDPGGWHAAITALSADIASLVLGLAMALWRPLEARGGFAHLLWLWLGFTSLQEGITYWVLTPFGAGDTAMAAAALGWPIWAMFVAMAAGIAGMFVSARLFAQPVATVAGDEIAARRAMAWWPWLLAIPFLLVHAFVMFSLQAMSLSVGEVVVVAMAGVSNGVFAPMSFIFARQAHQPAGWQPPRLSPWPVAGIVAFVVLVALQVLMRGGITIGG
ncbi:conserved membrane protein of unknown function [Micropruina glycogenica]|jgi:hypothetical protein|uniref:Uncharacterized protein n=2 Tax=Micropruina glycogenica TaxID=75385 RepID=A0A2N9JDA1_9ACTN|nr:conserved membrane protein of unknown function [Micropruina glycogenica]